MHQGMIDAVKACLKEEMRMDVISNNLANTSVPGHKKSRISFQTALRAEFRGAGTASAASGTVSPDLVRIEIDHTQGDIRATGNELDLAVHGKGFFKIMTPDGIRYTRKGNFALDTEGDLVTQNGDKVLGEGGPIQVSGNHIEVGALGGVSAGGEEMGRLDLVSFEDPKKLAVVGRAAFANPSGEAETPLPLDSRIKQGYLEQPNVQVAEEMVSMIHCMRAFESYQKVIQILDDVNQRAINEVSRIR
ncbi:MAG: flagellar hook-basal body protein [Deltaproteobacteria bacterium]|nr:flagellar hook-basal body protein [Deltaproteobacteria bacterium]